MPVKCPQVRSRQYPFLSTILKNDRASESVAPLQSGIAVPPLPPTPIVASRVVQEGSKCGRGTNRP